MGPSAHFVAATVPDPQESTRDRRSGGMRPIRLPVPAGLLVGTLAVFVGGIGVVREGDGGRRSIAAASPGVPTSTTSTTTPTPSTTSTLSPTTTTTTPPPAPTTTAAPPVVVPPPSAAPTPTTRPTPPPAPPSTPVLGPVTDLLAYGNQLLREVVPARWLAVVPARVEVIAGNSSWSNWSGLIEIGDWHLTRSVAKAKNVLAHEWAHQVAWRYGTDAYNGAPPAGFPYNGPLAEEQWADCVAEVLSGVQYPSSGLAPCTSAAVGVHQLVPVRRAGTAPPVGPNEGSASAVRAAWQG